MHEGTKFVYTKIGDYLCFIRIVAKDTEQMQIWLVLPGISSQDMRRQYQILKNSNLNDGIKQGCEMLAKNIVKETNMLKQN